LEKASNPFAASRATSLQRADNRRYAGCLPISACSIYSMPEVEVDVEVELR
jgi:hypothetical protein